MLRCHRRGDHIAFAVEAEHERVEPPFALVHRVKLDGRTEVQAECFTSRREREPLRFVNGEMDVPTLLVRTRNRHSLCIRCAFPSRPAAGIELEHHDILIVAAMRRKRPAKGSARLRFRIRNKTLERTVGAALHRRELHAQPRTAHVAAHSRLQRQRLDGSRDKRQ